MNWLSQLLPSRHKTGQWAPKHQRRPGRVRPSLETLEDRTVPSTVSSFVPTDNDWDVSVPSAGTGNVFMGGVALPVPNGLPGGIKNVTWTAGFWSDTAGITVNWSWAGAAYTSFSTDCNALGVKPVGNN